MKTKFNIGDEIFFMDYAKPTKGIIKGIAIVIGDFKNASFEKKGTPEKPTVIYSTGAYNSVDEEETFKTKEELQDSLFAKL